MTKADMVCQSGCDPWWRDGMESLFALITFCKGGPLVSGGWGLGGLGGGCPPPKGQLCEPVMILLFLAWANCYTKSRFAGHLRRHVMPFNTAWCSLYTNDSCKAYQTPNIKKKEKIFPSNIHYLHIGSSFKLGHSKYLLQTSVHQSLCD